MTTFAQAVAADARASQVLAITHVKPYSLKMLPPSRLRRLLGLDPKFQVLYEDTPIREWEGTDHEFAREMVHLLNCAYQEGALSRLVRNGYENR